MSDWRSYMSEIERKRGWKAGEEAVRKCIEKRNLEIALRSLIQAGKIAKDPPITDVESLEQVVKKIFDEHDVLILPEKHFLQHLALNLRIRMSTAEKLARKLWREYIIMIRLDPKTEKRTYYAWVLESERHRLWHEDMESLSAKMSGLAKKRWEKEAKKREGKKFGQRIDWLTEVGKPMVSYRVIASYRIKEFLLALLAEEWGPKDEEYQNIEKANWSLRTMSLDDITLDRKLLDDAEFQREVRKRIETQKDRILRQQPIMPLVVMYGHMMLIDGYARFFALRELGIRRAKVYYGALDMAI